MAKLLENLKVIDPLSDYHEQVVTITIKDGLIEKIAAVQDQTNHNGHYVSPGWVDMGAHLSDPGFEHKESIEALANAAAFGGFTAVLCYPNTEPVTDDSRSIKALASRAKGLPAELLFMGALSPGADENDLAELYDMQQAGALAFSDGRNHTQSSSLTLRALQYMKAFDGLLLLYPEDQDLAHGGQMNEGTESVYLGMKGIPEVAESAAVTKLLHLHGYAGGRLHLQPITSPVALDVINGYASGEVSCAVSIAHLAWDDSEIRSFDTHYKINPPLRSKSQRDALLQAVIDDKVDALCSYHQAQGLEEKLVEWPFADPGMLSLQTLFPLALEHLVRPGHIDLGKLISLLSIGPRRILHLPELIIQEGAQAKLTVFDPEATWTFDKKAIFSRAVNSPLLGTSLTGKAIQTII